MRHAIRFGLVTPIQFKGPPGTDPTDQQRTVWEIADGGGVDHLWTFDHLIGWREGVNDAIFESWTVLAMMAQATTHARLGVAVTANLLRHPALLAKIGTTIDHFSGGRLEMALGASSGQQEFDMIGMPLPPPAERIRRLDESCSVITALWTEPKANFRGQHYELNDAVHEPKPLQSPHPPIWIGGYGPKGTLRVAAKHADVWNASGSRGVEGTIEAARTLDQRCEEIGRNPAAIRRSTNLHWDNASPGSCYELAARYLDAGFSEFLIELDGDDIVNATQAFVADGLPRLREVA